MGGARVGGGGSSTAPRFRRGEGVDPTDAHANHARWRELVFGGLAAGTRRAYSGEQRAWLHWCDVNRVPPLDPSPETLGLFLGWLSRRDLAYSYVRSHLSAIRSLHIDAGAADPTRDPRLRRALAGVERSQPAHATPRKLPLTPDLLACMRLHMDLEQPGSLMVWAALLLGVLGAARLGEITAHSQTDTERAPRWHHLSFSGGASPTSPASASLFLPRSKTDQVGAGQRIVVGVTGDPQRCAVRALYALLLDAQRFWRARGHSTIPTHAFIFSWPDGTPLTRSALTHAMRGLIDKLGLDPASYSGISMRKGGATAAHLAGLPDATIRQQGRWRSSAHFRYQHVSDDELARASARLIDACAPALGPAAPPAAAAAPSSSSLLHASPRPPAASVPPPPLLSSATSSPSSSRTLWPSAPPAPTSAAAVPAPLMPNTWSPSLFASAPHPLPLASAAAARPPVASLRSR